MSDEPATDLGLIARQQRQILAELGSVRDDMNVLTAIVLRQDATLTALLNAVRAGRPFGAGSSSLDPQGGIPCW